MRRRLLSVLVALVLILPLGLVAASAQPAPGDPEPRHEIWALDQGADLNRIHVYDEDLDEVTVIELDGLLATPHMIDFDSHHRYAFVAGTTGQGVAIIRTADYEVVDVVQTGAGAHMAAVTPDDASVWVANIGAQTFTEITLDLDNEVFEIGRELDVTEDPLWQEEFEDLDPPAAPVCHEYTADGRHAYVTLGPSAASGGIIVVDIASDEPRVEKAFSRDDVKANCGLALTHDGAKMFANWGDPGPAEDPPEQTGEWYVFDTSDHSLVFTSDETRGIDPHGVRITPDGRELWQVNRGSDNGIVIDPDTHEIIDDIHFPENDLDLGPDILDFSPDGTRAYVSLRGSHPVTGAPHVATGSTPGFAVFDVESRELVEVVEPAADTDDYEHSDFHGIGVRVIEDVTRVAGADRIGTAVAVSQASWIDGGASGAVLARADAFPDALAGVALSAQVGGPVLLTSTGGLADAVADELQRILPDGGTVHLLGGEQALSATVAGDVEALGFTVERLAGGDRYETAEAIAGAIDEPALLLVTTGANFPDAVAAGAAAAAHGGAVVLTTPDEAHPAADRVLDAHGDVTRYAVGGPAARAYPDLDALAGDDRFATAVAVAEELFDSVWAIGLARSDAFPDALSGGAHAASLGAPVLLTEPGALHATSGEHLCEAGASRVFAYGGPAALTPEALQATAARVIGDDC